MAMEFEYDEEGGTFFYFLLSFWGLVIIPATYYFWPRTKTDDGPDLKKRECNCEPCQLKRQRLNVQGKWKHTTEKGVKIALVIGWVIFLLLAYKVSKIQMEYVEYDPYMELEIERGASQKEIKKAYRKLSLIFHPDKETGDHKKFMRIAKAHAALTDEETMKNWEEYGNPDGPGVTKFGIALPKWIIEKENSIWVLAVYGLLFMVLLPVVVGAWWYRSIKFSKDQVLLDTTRLYYYFFQKIPNMMLKKVVMVLAGSFEFDKFHNQEIVERPSDNEEVPWLIKMLPNLEEKHKEKPLCYPYSVKARALLHAHFNRLELSQNTLEIDKMYVLKKTPFLVNEMVTIVAQLVSGAARNAVQYMPRLETVENCMKVSQMIIQGLDQKSSPLLQLPHIKPEMLKHFSTKKRHITRIKDFIGMKDSERKSLCRQLSPDEYRDVMSVCATMPHVVMTIRSEVLDDEDSTITAGSIVTVTVTLTRQDLEVLFEQEQEDNAPEIENVEDTEETEANNDDNTQKKVAQKAWEKPKKGKKKPAKPKKKAKQAFNWKAASTSAAGATSDKTEDKSEEKEEKGDTDDEGKAVVATNPDNDESEVESEQEEHDSEAENSASSSALSKRRSSGSGFETKKDKDKDDEHALDDEEQWKIYQEEAKKEFSIETKAKESPAVHCPHFPEAKQEGWWLYVSDKKQHMLITAPVQILTLKEKEEITLKFLAPGKPGAYTYTVNLKSDSFFDFDQAQNIKLDVKDAKIIEDHPQWDISEDEDAEKDDDSDSDYSTEGDDSD
ncbi:translocation protein SEC63 homolog [Mytilus trossulus]|uniref:translocation protein SEC63 homolog n=1 Tax=Mytilus trossulus TaxID=6551 RepID=UPI0030049F98